MRIGLIWGASKFGQVSLFNPLAEKYSTSQDWGTLCSLACSPLSSPKILHEIGTGRAKKKGYGYVLRVIARNKNVSRETLKSIAEDPSLEKRYSGVAQAALERGTEFANSQT
jgi:hypothetical protein